MTTIGKLRKTMAALPDETKVKFMNAVHEFHHHVIHDNCDQCLFYITTGYGGMCDKAKRIIVDAMSSDSFAE